MIINTKGIKHRMKKNSKKQQILNSLIAVELVIIGFLIKELYEEHKKEIQLLASTQEQQEEGIERLANLALDEDNISEEGKQAIEKISNISIHNSNIDKIAVDENLVLKSLGTLTDNTNTHTYNSLYDEKTNSIKWEDVLNKITENSNNISCKSTTFESLSEEEMSKQVELLQSSYNELIQQYPNYDTKELACKLEYYAILYSKEENSVVIAVTTNSSIIYLESYKNLPDILKTDAIYHEEFHLLTRNCLDNNSNNLDNYIPSFIKEIYATLYAAEINEYRQTSYLTYDEALDLIQATLALREDYQINDLLKYLVYQDSASLLQAFSVYDQNKIQFFMDNITALNGLDLLLNSTNQEKYPDLVYTKSTQQDISTSTFLQLAKLYYNNLILLNEYQKEMTLEDNIAFFNLFDTLIEKIQIDNTYLIEEETSNTSVVLLTEKENCQEIFIEYLEIKYNISKEEIKSQITQNKIEDKDYEYPTFLGEEKKEFYQSLTEQNKIASSNTVKILKR